MGSPDHAAEIDQGLFVHLILGEQFRVIAEIAQEPIQLPESSFGAIEPTREGAALEGFGSSTTKRT